MQSLPRKDSNNVPLHPTESKLENTTQHGLLLRSSDGGITHDEQELAARRSASMANGNPCMGREYVEDANKTEEQSTGASPMADVKLKGVISRQVSLTPVIPELNSNGLDLRKFGSKTSVCLANLPNEILVYILSHLPPQVLADVALLSKRFHRLVTTPHAWRTAFARFFPSGQNSKQGNVSFGDRRYFTLLTNSATWRSEYIQRTRLLRSLIRGRPAGTLVAHPTRGNPITPNTSQITYDSDLHSAISHMQAAFSGAPNLKTRGPRVIHATDDIRKASISSPTSSRVEAWRHEHLSSGHHSENIRPDENPWAIHGRHIIDIPDMLDISVMYGIIYGQACRLGGIGYQAHDEKRSRLLDASSGVRDLQKGIPSIRSFDGTSVVWIAKSTNVVEVSHGILGMLCGSCSGILTAYSLGNSASTPDRLERGQMTLRWVISPGVPLISIVVDQNTSLERLQKRKVTISILNALGEVYYLDDLPTTANIQEVHSSDTLATIHSDQRTEWKAWLLGKSVQWSLIEQTRREARPDPYANGTLHGTYSPTLSWQGSNLSVDQVSAETLEVETFLNKCPADFIRVCQGWDMYRRLEIDFTGHLGKLEAEIAFVITTGIDGGEAARIKRFTRLVEAQSFELSPRDAEQLFPRVQNAFENKNDHGSYPVSRVWSFSDLIDGATDSRYHVTRDDWVATDLCFGSVRVSKITACAMDHSIAAAGEFHQDKSSNCDRDGNTKRRPKRFVQSKDQSPDTIPGHRARYIAIGTNAGSILIYNTRADNVGHHVSTDTIYPLRVISTDSPQISSLALTALCLVHGGNDGVVQAWDALGSTDEPLRTINSRFSSRARRRLTQAEASSAGVGVNLFAAGSICLDPDPTVLRGIVSLGSQLRYWHYSSDVGEQSKGNRRRLRRSARVSNSAPSTTFACIGRSGLKDYIAQEQREVERTNQLQSKNEARLADRFGLKILGPDTTEEDALAYALMLSHETAAQHEIRRHETVDRQSDELAHRHMGEDEAFAEAIRNSLQDFGPDHEPEHNPSLIGKAQSDTQYIRPQQKLVRGTFEDSQLDDDLEIALRLSLDEN